MTQQELLTKVEEIKSQKTTTISDGDRIYVSEYSSFDFLITKYKIDEYCNEKKILYTIADQEFANTTIIDLDDLVSSFILQFYIPQSGDKPYTPQIIDSYPPYKEMVRALNLNHKIINLKTLINEVHTNLTTIDEESYMSLAEMFKSNDPESHRLATEIVTSSNRNDETTLSYLLKLYNDFYNHLILSGNPATYELLTAVEQYREKQRVTQTKTNGWVDMSGAEILSQLIKETRENLKTQNITLE